MDGSQQLSRPRVIKQIETFDDAVKAERDVESGYDRVIDEHITYWIAVEEEKRGHGLGRKVQVEVERRTALFGGKRIYIWTSSRDQYHPTRRFYERMGYSREATLRDYYKPGEDLIIYMKPLD